MNRFVFLALLFLTHFYSFSQDTISLKQVERIINFLASDSMKGRANGSPELFKAAQFISAEFKKDSLTYCPGYNSFMQPFVLPGLSKDGSDTLYNVIGVIEGKTRPTQVVIFSAHYDHIGMVRSRNDSIYNGANDNASGTTALLALAHYFAMRGDNDRTLIFCAFAGEELGMKGSQVFARKIVSDSIVAMINIEMIGSKNYTGKNAFCVTGAKRSGLTKILKKNLQGSPYKIVGEPPREQMLFERSDNLAFAVRGVPAHTLMCSDDNDRCYHKTCDEVGRLDLENMTNIIKAIAIAVRTLVDGSDTPSRIQSHVDSRFLYE